MTRILSAAKDSKVSSFRSPLCLVSSGDPMLNLYETTLARSVAFEGVGVHSGAPVRLVLHPGTAGSGFRVLRSDVEGAVPCPMHVDHVHATALCTVVGLSPEQSVATVEHVMAALRVAGVDNVLIEVNGPEMPIMDGSSRPFLKGIDEAGVVTLRVPRRFIKVLKPVRVQQGEAWAELRPAVSGFRLDVTIDFDHEAIGRQRIALDLNRTVFDRELAGARTFGFMKDVEPLRAQGFAMGSSFENTVVVGDQRVENPEGLRWRDEFVRHKALDAVGDLALSGLPLQATYVAYRSGHKLNVSILRALLEDTSAWAVVESMVPAAGSTSARRAVHQHEPR